MLSFENGIRIQGMNLPLDARRRCERGLVTHAHADHVARHRRWLATPGTALLCARRWKARDLEVHEFGAPWREGEATVTLLPAGHILGSAMVLVEARGHRILYTGDFRLRPSMTAEPCQPVEADVLIMECTFGDPRYRFPDREGVVDDLCTFVEQTLAMDAAPVLIAYSLGKAQEIAGLMRARGYAVALHARGWAMLETYRELGVALEGCERYAMGPLGRGVLIVPPGPAGRVLTSRFRRRRTALISGWALRQPDRGAARFGRYDAGFPISDHADYGELLEMIGRVKPRRIYTLHGAPMFAERLRARGFDAWPAHAPAPPLPRARARQMQLL